MRNVLHLLCEFAYLRRDFEVTAVDVSEQMLRNSRELNPGVLHHVGDMKKVRLEKKFRGVIIHDAIDYLLNESDINATLTTVVAHLEPGGVFITAPQYKETFRNPHIHHGTHSDGETEVTCISYDYDPDPNDTTVESLMVYFINKHGALNVEFDRHTTGLFLRQTWLTHLARFGLHVECWPCEHVDATGQQSLLLGTFDCA